MRTRRIAIACRRTGSANPVAIAPSATAGATENSATESWATESWIGDTFPVEFLPLDLTPLPSRIPGAAGADARPPSWIDGPDGRADPSHIPTPTPPPPGDQDLTLADLTVGRRNLDWDRNPGWPAGLDWTRIARAARNHEPRHARRAFRERRAFMWTGAGIVAAVLLTILVTLLGELLS